MEIEKLIRKNIWELQPYSCAREEYEGGQAILLDANENPFDTGVNRYPDPYQRELKKELARLKEVKVDHMILGNGSDELIDLLIRSFCEPAEDNIVVFYRRDYVQECAPRDRGDPRGADRPADGRDRFALYGARALPRASQLLAVCPSHGGDDRRG